MKKYIHRICAAAKSLRNDERGMSHTTEIMIGIAIVVVVGGLIITLATGTIPQIFEDLMTKVSGLFSGTP